MQRVREGAVVVEARGNSKGAAMVEFAIIFPFFLLLVTVMFNYAITFWRYNQLQYLTDNIARELSISPRLCGMVGASELGSVEYLLSPTSPIYNDYRRYVIRHARKYEEEGARFSVYGNSDGISFRVESSTPMGCPTCVMMRGKRLKTVAYALIENKTC